MKKDKREPDSQNHDDMGIIEEMLEEAFDKEEEEESSEKTEAEILTEKVKEAEDKLLRQAAEADNYRKRLIRETDDRIKYANQSLLEKFLPILDNFDLALKHTEGVDAETVIEGISLNQKAMLDIIGKAGMVKLSVAAGDPFNPNEHEAVTLCNEPGLPNNAVALVIQNGYKMADRIVRSAKVQVNKYQ